MPRIATVEVKSSNIKAVGYDPVSKVLQVDFKNNTSYQYADVPHEQMVDLLSAPSVGKYLAAYIKPTHAATKLEDED